MKISPEQRRKMRGIGHTLKPVVQVGQHGLSDNVVQETDRALSDHELIKIQMPAGEPRVRKELIESLCKKCGAELVQSIGRVALIYRANPNANPKLSNLQRDPG